MAEEAAVFWLPGKGRTTARTLRGERDTEEGRAGRGRGRASVTAQRTASWAFPGSSYSTSSDTTEEEIDFAVHLWM